MATRKKKKSGKSTANATESVHAAELVELEAEISDAREKLNDAVGRYNFALERAKVAAG